MFHSGDIKFSIIIPTCNSGKTIAEALNSIAQQQTFSHLEVIIIDAKSSDNTLSIVNEYRAEKLKIKCISEKDNGIYDAMNKGIKMAKGEWLFFLGSDDRFYTNDVLLTIGSLIDRNQNAKMIYGNVQSDTPIDYKSNNLVYDGEFDENKLLRKNICHQSIFYHNSLFRHFGLFRTEYRIFADYDFNLRCFNAVKPLYFDKIIAYFNTGGQSKNNQHSDKLFEENFLENMAVYYPYNFRHPYFTGRKKELSNIVIRHLKTLHLKASLKATGILIYQLLKSKRVTIN